MIASKSLVLLVGAPRSGTTWVQQLLGAHTLIATPQETDVFSRFLQPLYESWIRETRGGEEAIAQRRFKGLHGVLTESEFAALGSNFLNGVIANAAELKPGSEIIVEKTPAHSRCSSSVSLFAPSAKIVHLIRDGRDVACSLVASGNSWGGWWAPKSVGRASEIWNENVLGARGYAGTDNYLEVRYEDMRTDGASTLEGIFAHIGIAATTHDCELLIETFALDKMAGGESSMVIGGDFAAAATRRTEPAGFFGKGGSGSWRTQWNAEERLAFENVAGSLLRDLGYEVSSDWAGTSSQIQRFRRHRLRSERSRDRLDRFVTRLNQLRRKQP